MDLQPRVTQLFDALGQTITVGGVSMRALVDLPLDVRGPWEDDAVDAPLITVGYDDLNDNSLWPLSSPVIVIDSVNYRVIASLLRDGLVEIFMQVA